jgi:hypothetical protein
VWKILPETLSIKVQFIPHREHYSITNINRCLLYTEVVAVSFFQNHLKYIHSVNKIQTYSVKPESADTDHWDLNDLMYKASQTVYMTHNKIL